MRDLDMPSPFLVAFNVVVIRHTYTGLVQNAWLVIFGAIYMQTVGVCIVMCEKEKKAKMKYARLMMALKREKKTNKIVHVFVRAVRSIKDDGEKWLVVVAVMVLMFACCVMMVFLGPVYNADSQSGPFMSCR